MFNGAYDVMDGTIACILFSYYMVVVVVDVNNVKNDKEASEVTERKSSRMRWGR